MKKGHPEWLKVAESDDRVFESLSSFGVEIAMFRAFLGKGHVKIKRHFKTSVAFQSATFGTSVFIVVLVTINSLPRIPRYFF